MWRPTAKRGLLRKQQRKYRKVSATPPHPHPNPPYARAGSGKWDEDLCAQLRSRTVDRDRQLKAAVRVGSGGLGRFSEPALCRSPCECARSPLTERAGLAVRALSREKFGWRQWAWCPFVLKITVALEKGGLRCLFVDGSCSGAVTAAASRRDDAARAAAAADAARGARRVDGRTQRPPRRVRGRSRLHGRRRARDDGRADATPFAQPRVCPSRASSTNAACAAAAPR